MTRQELGMLEAARTACLAALQSIEAVINRDDATEARTETDNPWSTFDADPAPDTAPDTTQEQTNGKVKNVRRKR